MAKSFLRWAGGKGWLTKTVAPIIVDRLGDGTYYEPFLGSAAMFFAVQPRRATLSDNNKQLINTFRQVARKPEDLQRILRALRSTKKEYYRLRSAAPKTALEGAARFIYLNRNCWGGLYRENRRGEFNVPYGGGTRNHVSLAREPLLQTVASLLRRRNVRLLSCPFEEILQNVGRGDVIYCDPTYRRQTRHHFDRYGANVFDWNDQKRLASLAGKAFGKGALVIVSNASCFSIADLYPNALIIRTSRKKGFGNTNNRAALAEYVFVLDPEQRLEQWLPVGKMIHQPEERMATRGRRVSSG